MISMTQFLDQLYTQNRKPQCWNVSKFAASHLSTVLSEQIERYIVVGEISVEWLYSRLQVGVKHLCIHSQFKLGALAAIEVDNSGAVSNQVSRNQQHKHFPKLSLPGRLSSPASAFKHKFKKISGRRWSYVIIVNKEWPGPPPENINPPPVRLKVYVFVCAAGWFSAEIAPAALYAVPPHIRARQFACTARGSSSSATAVAQLPYPQCDRRCAHLAGSVSVWNGVETGAEMERKWPTSRRDLIKLRTYVLAIGTNSKNKHVAAAKFATLRSRSRRKWVNILFARTVRWSCYTRVEYGEHKF